MHHMHSPSVPSSLYSTLSLFHLAPIPSLPSPLPLLPLPPPSSTPLHPQCMPTALVHPPQGLCLEDQPAEGGGEGGGGEGGGGRGG